MQCSGSGHMWFDFGFPKSTNLLSWGEVISALGDGSLLLPVLQPKVVLWLLNPGSVKRHFITGPLSTCYF